MLSIERKRWHVLLHNRAQASCDTNRVKRSTSNRLSGDQSYDRNKRDSQPIVQRHISIKNICTRCRTIAARLYMLLTSFAKDPLLAVLLQLFHLKRQAHDDRLQLLHLVVALPLTIFQLVIIFLQSQQLLHQCPMGHLVHGITAACRRMTPIHGRLPRIHGRIALIHGRLPWIHGRLPCIWRR